MALAARKSGARVLRGREDDGYAGAGIVDATGNVELAIITEPAPSQRDMALSNETVVGQMTLANRLMSKTVHVSLDAPYMDDPQKTVVLLWGYGEATPSGQDRYQDDGAGTNPVPASERLFSQDPAFAAPRWIPGKPIHFHLRWEEGPLGKCACGQDPDTIVTREALMPGPVARHWFGDWDVVSYELRVVPGQMLPDWLTRTWHRDRVAAENWGGWEMDFPPGVPVYDSKGAVNVRALRKFGPPKVPQVTITRLDSMMRKMPQTEARIWEIFKWQDACEKGPRMHFFENHLETGKLTVTADELQKMIAQGVAAALAAEREAKKGKSA